MVLILVYPRDWEIGALVSGVTGTALNFLRQVFEAGR
jgi:hypothetical protein